MANIDVDRPEPPPPPPELPKVTEVARGRAAVEDSAHDHPSGTSRAAEHEEARSAAREEFAEASRGQAEAGSEPSGIPRQRETDVLMPSNEPTERLEAQPTSDVHERPDRPEQADEDRVDARPAGTAESPASRIVEHGEARLASADELRAASADKGLAPEEKQEFREYERQLVADGRTREVAGAGAEYDYQRRHCGDTEFRLTGDETLPSATWADGLNREEALAQDAKYVGSEGPSFYKPDTLPPFLAEQATNDIDLRLSKYRDVIEDPANPVRGLEIVTNDREAAAFFESRMDALDVDGKVTHRD